MTKQQTTPSPEEMRHNFGQRLNMARRMKGWSMERLAKEMGSDGVSRNAISKYERGLMMPSSTVLSALGRALDQRPDFFFRKLPVDMDLRKVHIYVVPKGGGG